jgi:phosphate transport system protein
MTIHFRRESDKLKKMILSLSALVEESVKKAARSVLNRDSQLAQEVIDEDPQIDAKEVEVEEECLKILALYQPVANDLRYIVAVLKINNDLERIGDLAVNVAQGSMYLAERPEVDMPFDFPLMAGKTREMVSQSLDALVDHDTDIARRIIESDDIVDSIHSGTFDRIEEMIRKGMNEKATPVLLRMLSLSHSLERIGMKDDA